MWTVSKVEVKRIHLNFGASLLFLFFFPTFPAWTQGNCSQELETLTAKLLEDLPSYANRAIQKARRLNQEGDFYSYVLLAGKPEFEPLPLNPGPYSSLPSPLETESTQQVFFTTRERRYRENQVERNESYHWLFLTQTERGWRLAMIFTRYGSPVEGKLPTPPQETSNASIGQAIRTWLRDCRAGAISF